MIDFLKVGTIVNTHALQGELRVFSDSHFKEERFKPGAKLLIDFNGEKIAVEVKSHRPNKTVELIKFVGMNHINDVEKYKGCDLLVDATSLGELPTNEFYFHEIMGCAVKTTAGEELGEIIDILQPGANDVWVVKQKDSKKEILIPYIDDVVKAVDPKNKLVTVELLEGLI